MQDDSQQTLERLISEGQNLLENYQKERKSLKSPGTNLGDTIISEFAGSVVSDAFESGRLGSRARSLSRSSMKTGRKNQIQELDNRYLQLANNWISRVSSYLGAVSTITSSNRQNSQRLVSKFSKIERAVRPDTKLRNGIGILKEFALQGVVRNEVLTKSKPKGLVVRPGEQFKAYSQILEIASRAVGHLIIVDPYPSRETLIVLQKSPHNQPVKFLTNPPQRKEDRTVLEALVRKMKKDRPEIDIRYAPEKTLHDRFMITETEAWHLGHSIKDFGNKLSAITQMNATEREQFENGFSTIWDNAKPV